MNAQITPPLEPAPDAPPNAQSEKAPTRRSRLWIGVSAVALLLVLLGGATTVVIRNELDPGEPIAGVTEVTIHEQDFDPPAIRVPVGTTVTWRWESEEPHNVVADDFASPNQTGGTFSHTFAAPGTYAYRCTLHFFMRGRVVVTE